MSETEDPARWSGRGQGAPEGFGELGAGDEAHGPSAEQLARMLDGVAQQVARPELAQAYRAHVLAAAGTSACAGFIEKVGAGAVVLALAGAAWWAFGADRPALATRVTPPRVAPAPPPNAAPQTPRPVTLAVEPQPSAPAPRDPAPGRSQAAEPRTPARSKPVLADDPAAELALLEQAQRALRDAPDRALALAERHRARFTHAQFEQEREMLAIEALIRLGRRSDAERRAQAFTRRNPQSSHRPRLHDLLRAPR